MGWETLDEVMNYDGIMDWGIGCLSLTLFRGKGSDGN